MKNAFLKEIVLNLMNFQSLNESISNCH